MLKLDSSDEYIDGYWKFSDFAVFCTDRFVNSRTEATTTLRLVGGSVLLDTVLYNLSEEPLLLDELECVTKSHQSGYVLSAGPGALPISGVYKISAHIDNQRVSHPMEPRLHVPSKDAVRFVILISADMTGCTNPNFSFSIILKGGSRALSELGPFRLSFEQLTQSFSETRALLERRKAINPDDVPTLIRCGLAAEARHDKTAQEVFFRILKLEPDNTEGLSFVIRNYSTPDEEKIMLYYKLESLNPQAATGSSYHVVEPLLKRAKEAWRHGDLMTFQDTLKEARRLAVKSGYDHCLKNVLENEIVLSIYKGNLEAAIDKARDWEHTKGFGTVWPPEAPKNAFVDRLKEALPGRWTTEIEKAIRDAIVQAADTA